MLAVATSRNQGETALPFFGFANDSLAHFGVGFTQGGQFFLDGLDAFDFKAKCSIPGRSIPAPSKSLIFHGAIINVTLPSVR